jgi:hypothetical protein
MLPMHNCQEHLQPDLRKRHASFRDVGRTPALAMRICCVRPRELEPVSGKRVRDSETVFEREDLESRNSDDRFGGCDVY